MGAKVMQMHQRPGGHGNSQSGFPDVQPTNYIGGRECDATQAGNGFHSRQPKKFKKQLYAFLR
jgi:hypothetical protein